MATSKKKEGFSTLITKFSKAKLPLSLTPDTYREFEKQNKPLSVDTISRFLIDEGEAIDEFTEFVPCCRLPETPKFYGLIYWQAGLMEYHYMLITFDKKGNMINKKRIGGTIPDNQTFKVQVATITSSSTIEVKEGRSAQNSKNLTPTSFSEHYQFSISENGIITNE